MNKKGLALQTVVQILIMAVFLIVFISGFFLTDDSIMSKSARAVNSFVMGVVGIVMGGDEDIYQEQASEKLTNVMSSLVSAFTTSGNFPCIANYGGIPDDIDGFQINILQRDYPEQGIYFELRGPKQVVEDHLIEGSNLQVCVVDAREFERKKLDGNCLDCSDEFDPHTSVRIVEGAMDPYPNIEFGGTVADIEDSGYIYRPDANHACFFPTKDGDILGFCDTGGGLFDDACMQDIGRLRKC